MSWIAPLLAAVLASGIGSVDAPAPIAASDDAETTGADFEGRYRFSGGQKERDGVDAAIEKAVQALLPFLHGLARKRLGRANIIPETISISMEGNEMTLRYGDLQPMQAPLDGSVRHWRNREGSRVKIKIELRGNTLVQTTWNSGGRRIMKWRRSDDGKRLRLHSVMSSPQLPEPIDYRLTFRK